jgi:hypothetical protein
VLLGNFWCILLAIWGILWQYLSNFWYIFGPFRDTY